MERKSRIELLIAFLAAGTGIVALLNYCGVKLPPLRPAFATVTPSPTVAVLEETPKIEPMLTPVRSATQRKLSGAYNVQKRCDTAPDLLLSEVTVTRSRTILRFRYIATGYSPNGPPITRISVYPPDSEDPFYLTDVGRSKRFRLLKVHGVAEKPDETKIEKGDIVSFTLEFERIDDSMTNFHALEGDNPDFANAWNFWNITLQ